MAKIGRNKRSNTAHYERRARQIETKTAGILDDLAEFEAFRADTLKAIRKDIAKGLGPEEIRKKYLAILQGRLITEALTTEDTSVALAITKDVADRVEGKAKERQEHTHRLEKLSDKELDALLQSEEKDLEQMVENFQSEH